MTSYIGHTNKIPDGTVTVTSEAAGYEKENAHDWLTYDYWKAGAAGSVYFYIDFGASVTIDSWGCAFHDLADNSGLIRPEYSATGAWAGEQASFDSTQTPADNSIIFRVKTPVSARYWRFAIESTGSASQIGDLHLGEALSLPYGMRIGFSSPENNRKTKVSNNVSQGGHLLGRSVYYYGGKCTITQNIASETWVDANWLTLIQAIETHAFYFLWDEENRPAEAAFCWTGKKLEAPTYTEYGGTDSYLMFTIPATVRVE